MRTIFFAIITILIPVLIIPLFILYSCNIELPQRRHPPRMEEVVESDFKIQVYNHDLDEDMELYLEEYISQVVAAEVPAAFELEALKAQAIAARTFVIWRVVSLGNQGHESHPGTSVCTSHLHCQEWLSMEEIKRRHGEKWMEDYLPKINQAINETRGLVMTYDGQVIEPLYHSTSGGRTENSEDVFASARPYLKSVASPHEKGSPVLTDKKEVSIDEFIKKLEASKKDFKINKKNIKKEIDILSKSAGGRVKEIRIGNSNFTGTEIRNIFELRSADFTIDTGKNDLIFKTKGYGHGVGMSQWGAQGMAEQGSDYEEILTHYYQGINLNKLASYKK